MPVQILDIPPGLSIAQLESVLNDRIKNLNLILNGVMSNPATGDLDMATGSTVPASIHNLADPTQDLDAVNYRTLKRFPPGGGSSIVTQGTKAYAAVFDKTAALVDGEEIPAYIVGVNRDGSPKEAWLYSREPAPSDVKINFAVFVPGQKDPAPTVLLINPKAAKGTQKDLLLPAGQTGPVFFDIDEFDDFAVKVFPKGTALYPLIVQGSAATLCSMGLVILPR